MCVFVQPTQPNPTNPFNNTTIFFIVSLFFVVAFSPVKPFHVEFVEILIPLFDSLL
jgi:hypothetical protein